MENLNTKKYIDIKNGIINLNSDLDNCYYQIKQKIPISRYGKPVSIEQISLEIELINNDIKKLYQSLHECKTSIDSN